MRCMRATAFAWPASASVSRKNLTRTVEPSRPSVWPTAWSKSAAALSSATGFVRSMMRRSAWENCCACSSPSSSCASRKPDTCTRADAATSWVRETDTTFGGSPRSDRRIVRISGYLLGSAGRCENIRKWWTGGRAALAVRMIVWQCLCRDLCRDVPVIDCSPTERGDAKACSGLRGHMSQFYGVVHNVLPQRAPG